jgi:hypothetical protein
MAAPWQVRACAGILAITAIGAWIVTWPDPDPSLLSTVINLAIAWGLVMGVRVAWIAGNLMALYSAVIAVMGRGPSTILLGVLGLLVLVLLWAGPTRQWIGVGTGKKEARTTS